MSAPIETIKLKDGNTLLIFAEHCPIDPREEYYENCGKMYCFHRIYKLGDENDVNTEDYSSFDEMIDDLTSDNDIVLPLYLYDHSGITISTTPFSCPWDSGQVGFITMSENTIKDLFGGDRDKALKCLESEVEVYDQYLRGDVYGYRLEDADGNEIDACWGFYGYDHEKSGLLECAGIVKEEIID